MMERTKKSSMLALLLMLGVCVLQAQNNPTKQLVTEPDGFIWQRYTFYEGNSTQFAAFTKKGVRITPNSTNHIRYVEGGFFEVTERVAAGEPYIHHLYNIFGDCIVCRSMAKHVIRIYPDQQLIVAWRHNADFSTIAGSVETFSFDGRYYAEGDLSANKKVFDEVKKAMSTYPLSVSAQPSVQEEETVRVADKGGVDTEEPAGLPAGRANLTETARRKLKGSDGYPYELRTFKDDNGRILYAAFSNRGKQLTDYTDGAVRYRTEGFFEVVGSKQADKPVLRHLYNLDGNPIIPASAAKNMIKFYPEEKLVVAWNYLSDYSVIESSVVTYSYDGRYTANGDLSRKPGAFDERKSPVSWNTVGVPTHRAQVVAQNSAASTEQKPASKQVDKPVQAQEKAKSTAVEQPTTTAQAALAEQPGSAVQSQSITATEQQAPKHESKHRREAKEKSNPRHEPEDRQPQETKARQRSNMLFAAKYSSSKGVNPDNGLEVESDGIDPEVKIWNDSLTENGYTARYDHTDSNGKRVYVGGFVGMKAVYTVDKDNTIVKQLYFNSPAGRYSYIYTLTPVL